MKKLLEVKNGQFHIRYEKGDKVTITRKDTNSTGMVGTIQNIDGEYHYVQVKKISGDYVIELYRHEITPFSCTRHQSAEIAMNKAIGEL